MLTEYIEAAMKRAHYEIMEDDEGYWGEIPGFQGVWANEENLAKCQSELKSALEDWLLFRIRRDLEIPVVDKINLNPKKPRRVLEKAA